MNPTIKIFIAILTVLSVALLTGVCYHEFLLTCKENNSTLQPSLLVIGTAFIMFMSLVNIKVIGWIKSL